MKIDLLNLLERAGSTFVQSFVGILVTGGFVASVGVFDWRAVGAGVASAAVLSLLKSLAVAAALPPAAAGQVLGAPTVAASATGADPSTTATAAMPAVPAWSPTLPAAAGWLSAGPVGVGASGVPAAAAAPAVVLPAVVEPPAAPAPVSAAALAARSATTSTP